MKWLCLSFKSLLEIKHKIIAANNKGQNLPPNITYPHHGAKGCLCSSHMICVCFLRDYWAWRESGCCKTFLVELSKSMMHFRIFSSKLSCTLRKKILLLSTDKDKAGFPNFAPSSAQEAKPRFDAY